MLQLEILSVGASWVLPPTEWIDYIFEKAMIIMFDQHVKLSIESLTLKIGQELYELQCIKKR